VPLGAEMSVFAWLALIGVGGIAVVWVAYPLAVAALAALRRPRATHAGARHEPAVTVVIATRETPDVIRSRVRDIRSGSYPAAKLDIVVAVDPLSPHRGALPSELGEGVTIVVGDAEGGKAAALNAGVRAARGEILVFADSWQRFHPDALRHLADGFADPRVAAVSGRLELERARGAGAIIRAYWSYEVWLRRNEARLHSTVGVVGAINAVRRDRWAPLPAGLILDDVHTPMRLALEGARIEFANDAIAFDPRPPSPRQEFPRKVRTLTGVLQLCAWLPGVLVPVRNPLWAQFVCHKLLRMLTPYFVLAAAVGVAGLAWLAARGRWSPGEIALVAAALLAGVAWTRWGRRLREIAALAVMVQAALVIAAVNAARGNWNVWHR
jgi:cellulose synthase/poly-beta-1,6-N-acetylglucosamine synthase-like glycosyltransferase